MFAYFSIYCVEMAALALISAVWNPPLFYESGVNLHGDDQPVGS